MPLPARIATPDYLYVAGKIGAALRLAREAKGLSLRDVQRAGACDRGTLSRVERGEWCPSIAVLLRLCQLYRIYPGLILEGSLK